MLRKSMNLAIFEVAEEEAEEVVVVVIPVAELINYLKKKNLFSNLMIFPV